MFEVASALVRAGLGQVLAGSWPPRYLQDALPARPDDTPRQHREDIAVKFVLEVDISGMTAREETGKELGRILRYWAGAVQQVELKPGQGSDIYDSAYRPVGRWAVTDTPDGLLDKQP